jgi:hypothetical protein
MLFTNTLVDSDRMQLFKIKALALLQGSLIVQLMIRLVAPNAPCHLIGHLEWL